MMKRLHIGAGGILNLTESKLAPLIDRSWIHLGDAPSSGISRRSRTHGILGNIRGLLRPYYHKLRGIQVIDLNILLEGTKFLPFHYEKGNRLEFGSDAFSSSYRNIFLSTCTWTRLVNYSKNVSGFCVQEGA